MMVKICGITNLEDAVAAAGGGAAALGFNFYPKSPRYIEPADAARIIDKLPAAIWKVGIFVNESAARVAQVAAEARLDVAQLHGGSRAAAIRIWRAASAGPGFTPDALDGAEAFLLDAPAGELYGGTGRTFDWSLARNAGCKIILAGGLDGDNVRAAIEAARPWGVDACSRLERAPGRKDHRKMARFLQAAMEGSL